MATATLTLSKTTAGAVSTFTGTEVGYNEFRYTTPTVDGEYITITVPSNMVGVVFNAAQLTYTVSSDSGTRKVQYDSTAINVTNANLLEKLQNGETEISIYFSFRATPGGGDGFHSAYCTWSNITVTVDYIPAGLISGTLTSTQGSSLTYAINDRSIAKGESIPVQFTINPASTVSSISFKIGDSGHTSSGYTTNTISVNAPAGVNTTITAYINIDDCTLTNNVGAAYVSAVFGTSESTSWSSTTLNLVNVRVAPVVSASWSDSSGLYTTFGSYIQNKSTLSCTITVTLDTTADSTTYISSRKLTINNSEFLSGDGTFTVGTVDASGTVSYTVQVTDNFGVTGTLNGSLSLLAYSPPALTALSIQRYNVNESKLDDTSDRVCITMTGSVTPLASSNAWTVTLGYTNGITTGSSTILTGTDGTSISYNNNTSLFTTTLATSYNWTITITIADQLSSVSYETVVQKTGALFNIETFGVAVGMRSSGSSNTPKFETDYESHFYKDATFHENASFAANKTATFNGETAFNDDINVEGSVTSTNGITVSADVTFSGTITDANGRTIAAPFDSGWQTLTLSNCVQHTDYATCACRKIGNVVYMRGVVKPSSSISSSASVGPTLTTLPSGYRPPYNILATGAGIANATGLEIDSDGSVKIWNRVGASLGTNERISLMATFTVD